MKVKGKNLVVKAGGVAVGCSRSCELTIEVDVVAVADSQSGAWQKLRAGKKSWSVTVSGLVDVSGGIKSMVQRIGTEVQLQFVNSESNETLSGAAICKSAKITGTIRNLSQYSCEFQGSGALS